jgi:hypothetical protein
LWRKDVFAVVLAMEGESKMTSEPTTEGEKWWSEVTVELKDERVGYAVTLKGNEIPGFFQTEYDAWNALGEFGGRAGVLAPGLTPILEHNRTQLREAKLILEQVPKVPPSQLMKRWSALKSKIEQPSPGVVYSKSALGVFLMSLYHQDPDRGVGAYKYFSLQNISPNNRLELRGFLDAYSFESPIDSQAKKRFEAELKSLENARNDWEQRSHNIANVFDQLKAELKGWKDGFVSENLEWVKKSVGSYEEFVTTKTSELKALDTTYREKLKLEAPVKYWQDRGTSYRKRGRWWLAGLCGVVVMIMALLTIFLYEAPEAFHHRLFSGDPEAIKGIIVLAAIFSFGAYLARVFARMAFSSFHIQRDAEEREQLTLVYLALTKEGKLTEKDREIILQALFSRVETGLLGGDSSPTMPNITSMVEKLGSK